MKRMVIIGPGGGTIEYGVVTLAAGTVELSTKLKKCVVQLTQVCAPAGAALAEQFTVAETDGDGVISVPADGKLTIKSSNGASTAKLMYAVMGF
jgi:hypothetical protein